MQTQSLVANKYLSAESTPPSSASSSPNSDEASATRPGPLTSYQPRVLLHGTSASQSRVAAQRVSPTDDREQGEQLVDSNPSHSSNDLFEPDEVGSDSLGHWARELAALELATKDMVSEDEESASSPPIGAFPITNLGIKAVIYFT